ncbi:MAG: MurR/RpiR family transcriptional regulator [Synergistales bacterium]
MPPEVQDVLARLAELSGKLAPQQLKLARFIHFNLRGVAFMNSVSLAQAAGVSNPTVIRLAFRLGYSGFPEFQKALQSATEKQYDSLERFQGDPVSEEEDFFQRVLSLEFHVLRQMKEKISEEAVQRSVELMEKRKTVFIVGLLANTCLAEYLGYFLSILRENVQVLTDFDHEAYGKIRDAGEDSVAVVYSFPRYPVGTQSLARLFRKEGIPVVGITDSGMSPLAPLANVLLEAPMKFITFIDPCAGAFAMTHALLTAFYMKNPGKMRKKLRDFEEFAAGKDLFERKDIDIVELV